MDKRPTIRRGTGERVGEAAQAPGRAPSGPRTRLLRVTALVAGATLFTGLLQGLQATVSQARTPSGSRTATVTLDGLQPRVPTADGSVTVSGTITNKGKSKITDAHVGVRTGTGEPLATRSSLTAVSSRGAYDNALDGDEIDGHSADVADIAAGHSTTFSLNVPVSALDLGSTGVYELAVTLDGQTSADADQHVLGIQRTLLPWYAPGDTIKPTRISVLWPLIDRPHIAARGDTDVQQSPIFLDDDLAAELAPGGRLQQMVDLAKNLQVTWVVDPDLLATVEAMTKPYRVAGPGGDVTRTTPGTGTTAAKAWLNALRSAVTGAQVISLPFGDTDIASLAHQTKSPDVAGSVTHLKTAVDLGRITTDTILATKSTANVAWPVNGALDPSIVSVARTGGATRIIARSDTFSDGSVKYTPTAPRPIGGGTTAMVADSALSTAFSGSLTAPDKVEAAVQDFIAQTLVITKELPQKQRDVLVAPQRTPTAAQAQAMVKAVTELSQSPWDELVPFDTAAKSPTDSKAGHRMPSARSYPKSLSKQELPRDAFKQIQVTQKALNGFVVILTRKDKVTVPFGNAVLRAMSTGWRGNRTGAADFRNSMGNYLNDLINSVHIVSKSSLTLSGRSGTIPVTVKNELTQPITGLELRLASTANIRLEIKTPVQPITIDGGHTRTLKFQTKASANGKVPVNAQLYTTDGALYGGGGAIQFDVKVTKITDQVMLIIAGGLLLLVLAGVRIYRQRKRQAAAGDADGGPEDDEDDSGDEGGTDGSEPVQPGDPAADTAPQSPEPSPTGEKVDG